MPRITAPVAQLTRSINSAARSAAPRAEAPGLSPKYAELLRSRSNTEKSDPVLSSHRPTTSRAVRPAGNSSKPLMQFHSSSPQQATPVIHADAFVLPALYASSADGASLAAAPLRVPILPDNYAHAAVAEAAAAAEDVSMPSMPAPGSIVAAHPDQVLPGAPLSGVSGIGLDSVDLGFMSSSRGAVETEAPQEGRMIRDIWRGMVDNVLGSGKPAAH